MCGLLWWGTQQLGQVLCRKMRRDFPANHNGVDGLESFRVSPSSSVRLPGVVFARLRPGLLLNAAGGVHHWSGGNHELH